MDIDAIEKSMAVGCDGEYIPAQEISALVANQIPGRCKDCVKYTHGVNCEHCNIEGCVVEPHHYCSYFTKREA